MTDGVSTPLDGLPHSTFYSSYVLWGSAGHAKVLASAIALKGARVVALFDNRPVPSAIPDVPIYVGYDGFRTWAASVRGFAQFAALVAIGGASGRERLEIQTMFAANGLSLPPLVHPDASVCPTATLGAGTQVLAQAVVAADARLGAGCIINHGASVDHECIIGEGVHVAPGATLCGCVRIEDGAMVGAGAVILPRLRIGSNAIVGAGAVVTRNVSPGTVVVGNPAREVSQDAASQVTASLSKPSYQSTERKME